MKDSASVIFFLRRNKSFHHERDNYSRFRKTIEVSDYYLDNAKIWRNQEALSKL